MTPSPERIKAGLWWDESWNPVTGCTHVSRGCGHCWAKRQAGRHLGPWAGRKFSEVVCHEDRLEQPLHWHKPRVIAVSLMGDMFHKDVPFEFVDRVMAVVALCPQHLFVNTTKRPERALEYFAWATHKPNAIGRTDRSVMVDAVGPIGNHICGFTNGRWPLPNWIQGASVEDQESADKRIPLLLQIPAAVRFLSIEPMLGPVDVMPYITDLHHVGPGMRRVEPSGIHWIVLGGESGPGARPMHPDWARSVRDQCKAAGVRFFLKQLGEWVPWNTCPHDLLCKRREEHYGYMFIRVGKKAAGRLLDGRSHDEFPEVTR